MNQDDPILKHEQEVEDEFEKERLHVASQSGDLKTAEDLIALGHDVNHFDEIGKTPLMYAAENDHIEMVQFLLKRGADVNARDEAQSGNTVLREVAGRCSFDMAKTLIDAGADPTIPGWMKITALYEASQRKKGDGPKIYQLFLDATKN